eukprot:GDKH01024736.1.p1 GENE.GDKH01024736.1~~GDKH01024736.1.p1  ORF type:complete len:277 (-),score=24.19 GDKH01024736.1:559-1389(-)
MVKRPALGRYFLSEVSLQWHLHYQRRWNTPCKKTVRKYTNGLGKDLRVACIGAFVAFGAGDLLAQYFEWTRRSTEEHEAWQRSRKGLFLPVCGIDVDASRLFIVVAQGILLNGIMLAPFHRFINEWYGDSYLLGSKGRQGGSVGKKILMFQLVYMPIATAAFLFLTPSLEAVLREPATATRERCVLVGKEEVKRNFWFAYGGSWLFWPLSDAFCLRCLPLRLRPVWDSIMDTVWTSFLSFTAHEATEDELAKEAAAHAAASAIASKPLHEGSNGSR